MAITPAGGFDLLCGIEFLWSREHGNCSHLHQIYADRISIPLIGRGVVRIVIIDFFFMIFHRFTFNKFSLDVKYYLLHYAGRSTKDLGTISLSVEIRELHQSELWEAFLASSHWTPFLQSFAMGEVYRKMVSQSLMNDS